MAVEWEAAEREALVAGRVAGIQSDEVAQAVERLTFRGFPFYGHFIPISLRTSFSNKIIHIVISDW